MPKRKRARRVIDGDQPVKPRQAPGSPHQAESSADIQNPGVRATGHGDQGEPANGQGRASKEMPGSRNKLRRFLLWAGPIIVAAILAKIGTQMTTGASHYGASVARKALGSAGKSPVPLNADATISYDAASAVALAKPLTSGLGYARLRQGFGTQGSAGLGPFLTANGGAPVGVLHLDLVLTAQGQTTVRITGINIRFVRDPQPNYSGTYIPIPKQGGEAAYKFASQLDVPDPVISRVGAGQSFPDFNVSLPPGQQSTLAISFFAEKHAYSWVLDVTYQVGADRKQLPVREPDGKPFTVTGMSSSYRIRYASDYPVDYGYHLLANRS